MVLGSKDPEYHGIQEFSVRRLLGTSPEPCWNTEFVQWMACRLGVPGKLEMTIFLRLKLKTFRGFPGDSPCILAWFMWERKNTPPPSKLTSCPWKLMIGFDEISVTKWWNPFQRTDRRMFGGGCNENFARLSGCIGCKSIVGIVIGNHCHHNHVKT